MRRSKRKMSKLHVSTFDNMCCEEKQSCGWGARIILDKERLVFVSSPLPVPGSHHPGGAATQECVKPDPSATWRRESISGSSADVLTFSSCQSPPPPAVHSLKSRKNNNINQLTVVWMSGSSTSDACVIKKETDSFTVVIFVYLFTLYRPMAKNVVLWKRFLLFFWSHMLQIKEMLTSYKDNLSKYKTQI